MGIRLHRLIGTELRSVGLRCPLERQATTMPTFNRNRTDIAHLRDNHHRRFFSSESFMKSVLEQVKRDLEKDEKLQEAMKSLEKSNLTQNLNKVGKILSRSKDVCSHYVAKVSETSGNSQALKLAVSSAKSVICGINRIAEMLHDEKKQAKMLREKWKQRVVNERSQGVTGTPTEEEEMALDKATTEEAHANTEEYALVLAKESAWERFGSRLRDMPFLTNFFNNPVFDHLFGESSLASAIREMKKIYPSFNLPEFMELVEHVVAPHIVQCYLDGNAESLKSHCGEVAFNVLNASINERKLQKLSLDPSILILKDVELKGSIIMDGCHPWFIFNFTSQQINCLRDQKGKIVAGAIDDIREVVYSIALSRHPDLTLENLEYPYMVQEMAIIGNRPCW